MEKIDLYISFVLNLILFIMEVYVFSKIDKKKNILKYYTFLSNFIAMIISGIFIIYIPITLLYSGNIPIWLKGLRFLATYGLATTFVIYTFVLNPIFKKRDNPNENLLIGISYKKGNIILHYLCPIITLISFVFAEREPVLWDLDWTFYVAIPIIVYCISYVVLTLKHRWKEPYGIMKQEGNLRQLKIAFLILIIPLISVGLDFLLWYINILN